MSIIYTTRDGDVLDQICQNYYGSTAKIVEQVLESNPHLSELDAVFEAGVKNFPALEVLTLLISRNLKYLQTLQCILQLRFQ